ncbi:MAG: hypothetical protein Ct9H300mP32_0130 [Verrucomicrobiota bacterium]|nr:MAG: hypothetical protein Ct9H300mP32_0130 [Verrucomicrobiota bacterium]
MRIEGQKTAAFEVVDQFGPKARTFISCRSATPAISPPTGRVKEYRDAGLAKGVPRMFGFPGRQPRAAGRGSAVWNPQTVAPAIRIGNPASWDGAMNALKESNGHIAKVSDEEILGRTSWGAHRGRFCRTGQRGVAGRADPLRA